MALRRCAASWCTAREITTEDSWADLRVNLRLLSKVTLKDSPIEFTGSGVATLHQRCLTAALEQTAPVKINRSLLRLMRGADERVELFDSEVELRRKSVAIAELIIEEGQAKGSDCSGRPQNTGTVFFTGAGVSTAAGIGDFRGNFGEWTSLDHGLDATDDPVTNCDYNKLRPTLTHEAIAELQARKFVTHVISQNCDGLHTLAGTPPDTISELHGNVFCERCAKCCKLFTHNFCVFLEDDGIDNEADNDSNTDTDTNTNDDDKPAKSSKKRKRRSNSKSKSNSKPTRETTKRKPKCRTCGLSHWTNRTCPECGADLQDTIINFGDDLHEATLATATREAENCGLIVVLGSTLSVTPASSLCEVEPPAKHGASKASKTKKLVICNRQRTDEDASATIRIFGDCDRVMQVVMQKIMGEAEFDDWVSQRPKREEAYAKQRLS